MSTTPPSLSLGSRNRLTLLPAQSSLARQFLTCLGRAEMRPNRVVGVVLGRLRRPVRLRLWLGDSQVRAQVE
jgi:hypothetical protein